jgi:threonine dehydrogenase-like Zn-dependent dehydrogenase
VVSTNLPLLRQKNWDNRYEPSPKLVLLASYPASLSLDYQETLFNKETELVACRNCLPNDLQRAARLLETGALDVRPLLTTLLPAGEAAEGFRQLRERPDEHLTVVFDWSSAV